MGKEDDLYTFHRFANKFENEYTNRGGGKAIYHLKIKLTVFEREHISVLIAFLVMTIQETDPTEFHVSYYLSGDKLHLLIVFLDKIRGADWREPSQATIDNQDVEEGSDPESSGELLNSVL